MSACDSKWVKLRQPNESLFSCCEECKILIFCTAGTEIKELRGNGISDIGQGCTLKTEVLTIYGHSNLISQMKVESSIEITRGIYTQPYYE